MDAFPLIFIGFLFGLLVAQFLPNLVIGFLQRRGQTQISEPSTTALRSQLAALTEAIENRETKIARPEQLVRLPEFQQGLAIVRQLQLDADASVHEAVNNLYPVDCLFLFNCGKGKLSAESIRTLLDALPHWGYVQIFFALEILRQQPYPSLVGPLLLRTQSWWGENEFCKSYISQFIQERHQQGDPFTFGDECPELNVEKMELIRALISGIRVESLSRILAELDKLEISKLHLAQLQKIGRIWPAETNEPLIHHATLDGQMTQMLTTLQQERPRSVLVIGDSGSGKTSLIRAVHARLSGEGWIFFEASGTEILAGQIYIGEFEKRIQDLVAHLNRKHKIIWYLPQFHELASLGTHRYNPLSAMDMLLPALVSGQILIIGETSPEAFAKLNSSSRKLTFLFEIIRLHALTEATSLPLVTEWVNGLARTEGSSVPVELLPEAFHLAQQYIRHKVLPGAVFDFLKASLHNKAVQGNGAGPLTTEDLFAALAQLTGLPRSILDEKEGLNLDQVRSFFVQRVKGQPEAVECLIERVALLKAGLTDPRRPAGVFLFAGPTGSGKTQLAKTLAEFLFGSMDRLIRLDMSEFQTDESVVRLLGTVGDQVDAQALTFMIRRQPFSVILLDEFEKSHPNIWNLFLQVFDDGRLTDMIGNTADFSHAFIIMTCNVGSDIDTSPSLGFSDREQSFSHGQVDRAITRVFSKEFLNRLDRVLIFQPLNRTVMREILNDELNQVSWRRGLRHRDWAIEWDESAIDFLLDKGFTPDLGARPLKRAVERYLLTPLAQTIVEHQFPEGNQFLFVRSSGQEIQVEFIDPDKPEPEEVILPTVTTLEDSADQVRACILHAVGEAKEVQILQRSLEHLGQALSDTAWQNRKGQALQRTLNKEFWHDADRFVILDEIEFMDRLEAGFKTATSLYSRLTGNRPGHSGSFSRDLMRRLAEQLYLLGSAYDAFLKKEPRDAYLSVEFFAKKPESVVSGMTFAGQLREMYLNWAQKRRMQTEVLLDDKARNDAQQFFLMAVSGFGAYSILQPENGWHVFELPRDEKNTQRLNVLVSVIAQEIDASPNKATRLDEIKARLQDAHQNKKQVMVRHYRQHPSVLIRDHVRNWRSGRWDLILGGDFDVFM